MISKGHATLTFVLIIGCVFALSVVIFTLQNPLRVAAVEDMPPVAPLSSESLLNQAPSDITVAPLTQYNDIVERPLFLSSRRPPVAPDTPEQPKIAEDSASDELDYALLGIAITPERMMALLQIDNKGKVIRLNVGETIDGWILNTVRPDRVILRNGELTEELLLKPKPGTSEAPEVPEAVQSDQVRGDDVLQVEQVQEERGNLPALIQRLRGR